MVSVIALSLLLTTGAPPDVRPQHRRLRGAATHKLGSLAMAYDKSAVNNIHITYQDQAGTPRRYEGGPGAVDTRPIDHQQLVTPERPHGGHISGTTGAPVVTHAGRICPCTRMWRPVHCADDGRTYSNSCHAACAHHGSR